MWKNSKTYKFKCWYRKNVRLKLEKWGLLSIGGVFVDPIDKYLYLNKMYKLNKMYFKIATKIYRKIGLY